MATDEVGTAHGFIVINDVQVKIYGAGEGYVYRSKEAKEKDIRLNVTDGVIEGTTFEHVTLLPEIKEVYRIANEFYMMLKWFYYII